MNDKPIAEMTLPIMLLSRRMVFSSWYEFRITTGVDSEPTARNAHRSGPDLRMKRRLRASARHCAACVVAASWTVSSCARGGIETSAQNTASSSEAPRSPSTPQPDVRYDPSAPEVVEVMLRLAKVTADDVVYDLGCGDGRIVVAAVERYGARGVCIDIDPERIREARQNGERAGVADRIRFLTEDLFESDIRDATVVMLFLSPEVNSRLRPKLLRELEPGTRVVSHWHDMGNWVPDTTVPIRAEGRDRNVYLWIVPQKR